MFKIFIKFKNFIIDTKILISIAAVCLYYCTVQIGPISFDKNYASFLFISVLFTYNIPHFLNKKFNFSNTKTLYGFPILFAAGYFFFQSIDNILPFLSIVLLCLVVIFYYIPFGQNSLRTFSFSKIFIISLCWTMATVYIPYILDQNSKIGSENYLLIVERFLFIFAITIPFDIRDIVNDKKHGLKTIPIAIGIRNALILSILILSLYLLLSAINYGFGPIFYSRVICASFVLILLLHIKPGLSNHYFTGLIDSSMILQCILLVVFRQ